jgi:ADP-ribosylglycohydrolase
MIGAIIGDIVGSRWEFSPTNDYDFELFSEKNGFTDDTICTVAVADALLHGSDDYGKYIHEWCRKYPHPMGGYGARFAKWVMFDLHSRKSMGWKEQESGSPNKKGGI